MIMFHVNLEGCFMFFSWRTCSCVDLFPQDTPVGVEDEDLSPRQMMSDRQEATQFWVIFHMEFADLNLVGGGGA